MQTILDYYSDRHFFAQLDVRAKIIIALALNIMILSSHSIVLPLLVALICLLTCVQIKVPLKIFLLRFSEPLLIASVIILLKFLSARINPMQGLIEGLYIALRILGAMSVIAVISFTTPFSEILAGLSWLRFPREFIEVLLYAYRYSFLLFEEAMSIYYSQRNRLGYVGIKKTLYSFADLSGFLVLRMFEHNQRLAIAMEQRGYNGTIRVAENRSVRTSDILVSLFFIGAAIILWNLN